MKKSTFKNHSVGSTFFKIIISNFTYADHCKSENAWCTEEHITKYPTCEYTDHRLIKITDNTLDVAFSRFGWDSFTMSQAGYLLYWIIYTGCPTKHDN